MPTSNPVIETTNETPNSESLFSLLIKDTGAIHRFFNYLAQTSEGEKELLTALKQKNMNDETSNQTTPAAALSEPNRTLPEPPKS